MLSGNEAGVDLDLDLSTVNFGYHNVVSNNTDFIAELGTPDLMLKQLLAELVHLTTTRQQT